MPLDDVYEMLLVSTDGAISTERWTAIQSRLLELQPARKVELVGSPPTTIRVESYGGTEVAPALLADVVRLAGVTLVVQVPGT